MRKITDQVVEAFMWNGHFRRGKTVVGRDLENQTCMYLHRNKIAKQVDGGFEICDGGWQSNTTKERLNGLPNVSIVQKNYKWFLNGIAWDGKWVFIPNV